MRDDVVFLSFVDDRQDIQTSLITFNKNAQENHSLARSLLSLTSYWVYDLNTEMFGPSKFVGFKNMDFTKYMLARRGRSAGAPFNGQKTRIAIEYVLGTYYRDDLRILAELVNWGEKLLGPGVFDGIDDSKWAFISL
jgi:hypothetical protein